MSEALQFTIEAEYWQEGVERVAGVDEAGRGCLAGPVVAAACILPSDCDPLEGVRDSKLTRPSEREALVRLIAERCVAVGVGAASRREIDRLNVRRATVLAMQRALRRLGSWDQALIDGPLPPEFDKDDAVGIIDGDAISPSIACASIVAKTVRDRLMVKLARRHPEYHWETNVGYGTAYHRQALIEHGPTCHHRFSFRPVSQLALPMSGEANGQ